MNRISVITVVYNSINVLEITILSVMQQKEVDIEYIIIDGGSTDGSKSIIEKYANKLAYWVSEPDDGIYDAMNKGLRQCSGKWIFFLNSGDFFYNDLVLSQIEFRESDHVVYGNVNIHDQYGSYTLKPRPVETISERMAFSHQAVFVARHIMRDFDTKFKIVADHELFYYFYRKKYSFRYIDLCIATYDGSNGVSSKNLIQSLKESYIVSGKGLRIRFLINVMVVCIFIFIKLLLPNKFVVWWRKRRCYL